MDTGLLVKGNLVHLNNMKILLNINFSDYKIISFEINKLNKNLMFRTDGAVYNDGGILKYYSKSIVNIKKYHQISITAYDGPSNNELILNEDNYEILLKLNEIEVKNEITILKGYAPKTFHWLEFSISGGTLSGELLN